MRSLLLSIGTVLLLAASDGVAAAQSPQFVPAYPLVCQGPLTTGALGRLRDRETTTPFIWAATGAGAAPPGPGQCVWADRAARGGEIQPGGGNVICDFSGAMKSVPAGTYVEVGVALDPLVNNCMHLARYIGTVSPPFSARPALAPFVRQSIASLTPMQIASLQHGIQVMMSRPASDPTSYRFQANIHGTYDSATTPPEMQAWNNCEHGSYYFLSWHRMYLYFFDRILRAAAGDPSLVLPYWNWTDPAQRTLPLPFRQPANASNPLYIAPPDRPTALDAGTGSLGDSTVDFLAAFMDTKFDYDPAKDPGLSFGGQIANPAQFNSPHGDFEHQPHDVVHSALGGLMGDAHTAAQDPIFWLHHANIDRMWNRWLDQGGGRADPTDALWLNTRFTFYDEAGHAVYLTGAEVIDTVRHLNYRYDDEAVTLRRPSFPPGVPFRQREVSARDAAAAVRAVADGSAPPAAVPPTLNATTLAVATNRIELAGKTERIEVPLTDALSNRMHALAANNERGQVFLRLDDIRYEKSSGVYYEVYLNPPQGEPLDVHNPGYVGNLSLFGLNPHAVPGHPAPPAGDVFVQYDISHLASEIMAGNPKDLTVALVPRGLFGANGEPLPVPQAAQGTLGSVRIVSH
jgi:tyrosinase